jgi:hypothetical protein
MNPEDFTPEGRPNHYLHPTLGVCVLREGMTLVEFIASIGVPPPPLTTEQLRIQDAAVVETTFTVPTILRALIKDRFDLENRIRVLEGKPTITLAQFKAALANRIRGNGA